MVRSILTASRIMPRARPPAPPPPIAREKSGEALRQLKRVRKLCTGYPETLEKLSHGEPTFFARNKVFVMFDDHHHGADHLAVWLPAPPGTQEMIVEASPDTYFRPPYVGHRGWIGIRLDAIDDVQLAHHIRQAWMRVAPKSLQKQMAPSHNDGA
jgi:hypothetical protein